MPPGQEFPEGAACAACLRAKSVQAGGSEAIVDDRSGSRTGAALVDSGFPTTIIYYQYDGMLAGAFLAPTIRESEQSTQKRVCGWDSCGVSHSMTALCTKLCSISAYWPIWNGTYCVMRMATMSSLGSIKKTVVTAPAQKYSPSLTG